MEQINNCQVCNIRYAVKRPGHIFCSAKCREKDFRIKHPGIFKLYNLKYYKKNRKPCKVCGSEIPFPSSGRTHCSDICLETDTKKNSKRYRDKEQLEFTNYKIELGCKKCGYNKCAAALDFHHIDPLYKERRVTARMWKRGLGSAEIKKCILICKNCHMEEHHLD